jgi:hypothetical protein
MLRTPPHPIDPADRTERLLAAVRVALVAALTALVLAIARPRLRRVLRGHPRLRGRDRGLPASVGMVGAAAGRQLHHRRIARDPVAVSARRGLAGAWYAWTLVGCATAVSVALNVAHAPHRLSAQLFAALPRSRCLGALELLMSVARTGHPHTDRTPATQDRSEDRDTTATAVARPQLPAPDHSPTGGNGSGPPRDSRARVRELVARERATGTRLPAREVAAAAGISERRAYELLRAVRSKDQQS